jgi:hypothetical protein
MRIPGLMLTVLIACGIPSPPAVVQGRAPIATRGVAVDIDQAGELTWLTAAKPVHEVPQAAVRRGHRHGRHRHHRHHHHHRH